MKNLKTAVFLASFCFILIFCNVSLGGNFYYPDASQTDQGISTSNMLTVKDIIDSVGTSQNATIVFSRGSSGNTTNYSFLTSLTIPSNIHVKVEKGSIILIAVNKTLTINGTFDAGIYKVFDGDGQMAFGPEVLTAYPEWKGAKGDGTTDDTNTIQTIIDSGVPKVVFSEKVYLTNQLTLPNNITLCSDGKNSVLKLKTSSSVQHLLYAGSKTGITIRNLYLDGNSTGNSFNYSSIVRFANCSECLIENCTIYNAYYHGIWLASEGENNCAQNNYILNNKHHGITLNQANARIMGNIIENCSSTGINLEGSANDSCLITNNIIDGKNLSNYGISVTEGAHDIIIAKNITKNHNYHGIRIYGHLNCDIIISENISKDNGGHGFNIHGTDSQSYATRINLSGNNAHGNSSYGMNANYLIDCNFINNTLSNNNIGISSYKTEKSLFKSNNISSNTTYGVKVDYVEKSAITGNSICNNGSTGIFSNNCTSSDISGNVQFDNN